MSLNERQRILAETIAARDKAEALLRGLIEARQVSDKRLAELRLGDQLKKVTGKSSMDNAVAAAQRTVEMLDRALDDFKKELSQEDLAMAYDPKQ
ncbi:MAG: hypothetical protein JNM86_06785 [Phycisphaerae bacterium]|nr:hypothetical protein [Phycisphaerae bacterium]